VQGTACAIAYTTIYAIITNRYPNRKEALLGMLEASFGVGLICGPLAGSSLYKIFGFEMTFYIYGVFFLCCTFLLWYLIPELREERPSIPSIETGGSGQPTLHANHSTTVGRSHETEQELDVSQMDSEDHVTFFGLLWKHPIYTMSALAGTTV